MGTDSGGLCRVTLCAPAGTGDRAFLRRLSNLECHGIAVCRTVHCFSSSLPPLPLGFLQALILITECVTK